MAADGTKDFWKQIEQRGPAFQAGFTAGVLLAVIGYIASLTLAYMDRAGFGVAAAIGIALGTTLLLPTGIGLVIAGFVVAALSGGRLSWIAAAAGPLLAAGVWALIGVLLAWLLGWIAQLLFGRRFKGA